MSRRFISLAVASHLTVILAGFWLGRPSANAVPLPPDVPEASPHKRPVRDRPSLRPAAAAFQSTSEWSTLEFSGAWKALGRADLTKEERIRIRWDLLRNWAARDLPAAIEAALGQGWNDESNQETLQTTISNTFCGYFANDPEGTWKLISSGRYGIDTGMLRHLWIQAVADKAPLFLAARIKDLPERSRQEALNACDASIYEDQTKKAAFEILSKLPEGVITAEQLSIFAEPFEKR